MHDSLVRCSIPLSARINIHHCWCSKLSCLVVFLKTILIRYFSFYSLLFSSPKKNEKRPVFLLLIDERILSIRGSFVKKKYQLGEKKKLLHSHLPKCEINLQNHQQLVIKKTSMLPTKAGKVVNSHE